MVRVKGEIHLGKGKASADLWQRKIWPAILAIPVTAGTLLVAGLFVAVPYLDVVSSLLSGLFPYLAAIALLLTLLSLLLWRACASRFRMALLVLSAFMLIGWMVVSAQSMAFAAAQNVTIDARQLLSGFSVEKRAADVTFAYTSHDGKPVTLSVWRPVGAAGKAPVLVMTHGGGFAGGSVDEQILPYARWLANNGYLVIGANYTLSSDKVHAWDVAERQIGCALAWAGAHAKDYGGDVSRLGMYGESAGGNLVINVSYKVASGALTSPCGGEIPQVRAVSTIYPVVGVIEAYQNPHVLGKTGRMFDEQYLGGTPEQYPDRYASVQSANAITANAPPTLIAYGASDHLVTPNGTRNFITAAKKAGVDLRAIEVPYGEHGFDLVSGSVGAQAWRQATLEWFRQHLS
jgi:acetyl esterase/lipase